VICRCGNESSAWLCPSCVTKLEYLIVRVDAVVAEVRHVIPRLTLTATYGDRAPGVRAQHAPAPVSVDAVSSLDALQRWMLSTALRLAEVTRKPLTGKNPRTVGFVLDRQHATTRHTLMGTRPVRTARNVGQRLRTDHRRPRPPKYFAGRCANCDSDLYAVKGQPEARCGTCSETYEVLAWRNFAKDCSVSMLAHPPTCPANCQRLSTGLKSPLTGSANGRGGTNSNAPTPPPTKQANPSRPHTASTTYSTSTTKHDANHSTGQQHENHDLPRC